MDGDDEFSQLCREFEYVLGVIFVVAVILVIGGIGFALIR